MWSDYLYTVCILFHKGLSSLCLGYKSHRIISMVMSQTHTLYILNNVSDRNKLLHKFPFTYHSSCESSNLITASCLLFTIPLIKIRKQKTEVSNMITSNQQWYPYRNSILSQCGWHPAVKNPSIALIWCSLYILRASSYNMLDFRCVFTLSYSWMRCFNWICQCCRNKKLS